GIAAELKDALGGKPDITRDSKDKAQVLYARVEVAGGKDKLLHGLEGKVALITRATSGVGELTVKLFAEYGAKIIIADIQDQLGQGVCATIGSPNSIYVYCDVTNKEYVKNAVDIAYATYGKLDIMFNNAGIMDPYQAHVIGNEKIDFERILSVNVTCSFF
nr:secoisolariciresinol dehydrogenase-like [Tanacetum cinerariifolium]